MKLQDVIKNTGLPHVPTVSIAKRLRRVLLLQIIFIFSLYLLIFTVVNSVLNYESETMGSISTDYQVIGIAQTIKESLGQVRDEVTNYSQNPSPQSVAEMNRLITSVEERQAALEQTARLISVAAETDRAHLTHQIDYVKTDLDAYVAALASFTQSPVSGVAPLSTGVTLKQLDFRHTQLIDSLIQVRARAESMITEGQQVLTESLNRRTALLGLQAIVVVFSLIGIGYGYIAPAFQRVLDRLAKQNGELRDLDRTKMEFLSIASHQLKTPLSGLKWNLSLLYRLRHTLSEKDRKYLEQSKEHTDAMVRLVSNFLNVSRIEQGRMEFDVQSADIVPLVKAVMRINSRLAQMHTIQVKLHADRPRVFAKVDALLFKQVIQNLVDNAILYNKPAGLVTVSMRHLTDYVVVEVADTGAGISQAEQTHIFNQFFRGENAKTMRPDGSGLGLYFVKKIVQKMGGTISCKSKPDVGTAFTVRLARGK